ncbi:hypothetical protein RSAG8_11295, partial [Rhizoctonia solani AG-8 WAC10335]
MPGSRDPRSSSQILSRTQQLFCGLSRRNTNFWTRRLWIRYFAAWFVKVTGPFVFYVIDASTALTPSLGSTARTVLGLSMDPASTSRYTYKDYVVAIFNRYGSNGMSRQQKWPVRTRNSGRK